MALSLESLNLLQVLWIRFLMDPYHIAK
jgi:hypothetical protein